MEKSGSLIETIRGVGYRFKTNDSWLFYNSDTLKYQMINHVESINTQKEKDAVLSSMTEGVLVIDNNKKILMINEPGISYLNIESDNPTGCFVDDTIKDENFQIFINTLIKTKTPQKKEIRIKKNMKRFFLVNGTILQGEKMGALIVFTQGSVVAPFIYSIF